MNPAAKFSLLVFAPVTVAFLLPAGLLFPAAVLTTLLAVSDPGVPLSGTVSFGMWVAGPVLAALAFFLAGQVLVLPWLAFVFRRFFSQDPIDAKTTDPAVLERE